MSAEKRIAMPNSTEYTRKRAVCARCNLEIEQWADRPEAGYLHVESGLFACPDEFQHKLMAYPREGTVTDGKQEPDAL